jgi:hypothetical protein
VNHGCPQSIRYRNVNAIPAKRKVRLHSQSPGNIPGAQSTVFVPLRLC